MPSLNERIRFRITPCRGKCSDRSRHQEEGTQHQDGVGFDRGALSAVEAGLSVTFVSRWAVRKRLALGTLKLARVRGLKLSRMFSIAYPAGPEPTGNAGVFRMLFLARSMDLTPRVTGESKDKLHRVIRRGEQSTRLPTR